MTTQRWHGSQRGSRADSTGRSAVGARGWNRARRAAAGQPRVLDPHTVVDTTPVAALPTEQQVEEIWNAHGGAVYALACTLLGDEVAAADAVTSGMADFVRSGEAPGSEHVRRDLARHVYRRCEALAEKTVRTQQLPSVMLWLGELAQRQRACLALCVFGGHTYSEVASLLGTPPQQVVELLRSSLRDVGRAADGGTAATA